MKKPLLFMLFFLAHLAAQAQCNAGTILLNTQELVNNFPNNYPGCHKVIGSLLIGGSLTSLAPLSQIDTVTGEIYIGSPYSAPELTSLHGLHNLKYVGSDLFVDGAVLNDISALNSLTSVGGTFRIRGDSLTSLPPFSNLASVGRLLISASALTSINSFNSLTNVSIGGENIQISNNANLTSINGFNSIEVAPTINISNNANLTSINGFNALNTDKQDVIINSNPQLTIINAFHSLDSIKRQFLFQIDPLLSNWGSSFQNLKYIGTSCYIQETALPNLNNFSKLNYVQTLYVASNSQLFDISGLSNIIGSNITLVTIGNNPKLSNCTIPPICYSVNNSVPTFFNNGNACGCRNIGQVQNDCLGGIVCSEPANDECLQAISLTPGNDGVFVAPTGQTLTNARYSYAPAGYLTFNENSHDLWYVITTDADGNDGEPLSVSVTPEAGQALGLVLYSGDCGNLAVEDCVTGAGVQTVEITESFAGDEGIRVRDNNTYYLRIVDMNGIGGPFSIHATGAALPLHLLSFTVKEAVGCKATLSWTTADEKNVAYFEIESSTDGAVYAPLLPHHHTTTKIAAGNTPGTHTYTAITDLAGAQTYFRLKTADLDGSVSYSRVVSLASACNGRDISIYPNPARGMLYVSIPGFRDEGVVTIASLTGEALQAIAITHSGQAIDLKTLIPGVYVLLYADGNRSIAKKIIVE